MLFATPKVIHITLFQSRYYRVRYFHITKIVVITANLGTPPAQDGNFRHEIVQAGRESNPEPPNPKAGTQIIDTDKNNLYKRLWIREDWSLRSLLSIEYHAVMQEVRCWNYSRQTVMITRVVQRFSVAKVFVDIYADHKITRERGVEIRLCCFE